jgi:hypothetical protein
LFLQLGGGEKFKVPGQGTLIVSLSWKDKNDGLVQTEIVPFRSDGMMASYGIGHTPGVTRHSSGASGGEDDDGERKKGEQAWQIDLSKVRLVLINITLGFRIDRAKR